LASVAAKKSSFRMVAICLPVRAILIWFIFTTSLRWNAQTISFVLATTRLLEVSTGMTMTRVSHHVIRVVKCQTSILPNWKLTWVAIKRKNSTKKASSSPVWATCPANYISQSSWAVTRRSIARVIATAAVLKSNATASSAKFSVCSQASTCLLVWARMTDLAQSKSTGWTFKSKTRFKLTQVQSQECVWASITLSCSLWQQMATCTSMTSKTEIPRVQLLSGSSLAFKRSPPKSWSISRNSKNSKIRRTAFRTRLRLHRTATLAWTIRSAAVSKRTKFTNWKKSWNCAKVKPRANSTNFSMESRTLSKTTNGKSSN